MKLDQISEAYLNSIDEANWAHKDAYDRDYESSVYGFGRRQREDDERHDLDAPQTKSADVPHAVHIKGKHWKTFGSKQHAMNVARKIVGATVQKA